MSSFGGVSGSCLADFLPLPQILYWTHVRLSSSVLFDSRPPLTSFIAPARAIFPPLPLARVGAPPPKPTNARRRPRSTNWVIYLLAHLQSPYPLNLPPDRPPRLKLGEWRTTSGGGRKTRAGTAGLARPATLFVNSVCTRHRNSRRALSKVLQGSTPTRRATAMPCESCETANSRKQV